MFIHIRLDLPEKSRSVLYFIEDYRRGMQTQKLRRPGFRHFGVGGNIKGDVAIVWKAPLQNTGFADLTWSNQYRHRKCRNNTS